MKNSNDPSEISSINFVKPPNKKKVLIFALEVSLIAVLLSLWLSSESVRQSKNLWILFFYSLPSNFLIAVVPHEPVIFYFGKFYQPLRIALVAVSGTLLAEAINYSVFRFITDLKLFYKMRHSKYTKRILELFKKAPFVALLVAGFAPVPFYPFRFLVVLAHYPLLKYIIAVFISRTPRYFLLALLGYSLKIPDYLLLVLFVILVFAPYTFFLRKTIQKRAQEAEKNRKAKK